MLLTLIASATDAIMPSSLAPLSPSDWIQIFGIVLSTIASVVAIIISVITLRQNNKMIEESSRPVISIYTQSINPGVPMFYLVVKNFGHSPAYMCEFETDFDFSDCYGKSNVRNYLDDLKKCVIAPGQSKTCWLDFTKIARPVRFSIQYKSGTKKYSETFDLDLKAAAGLPTSKYSTPNKELLSISYSLQEMLLRDL